MTPSIDCQNLIKISEGLKLEAYRDTGGIWTIGWGHTGPEVHKDLQWKQAQADIALYSDVMHAWEAIRVGYERAAIERASERVARMTAAVREQQARRDGYRPAA